MKSYLFIPLMLIIISNVVLGAPYEITDADTAVFDDILEPVSKVYNLIKYAASLIALIFMAYAGITYMSAGNDSRQRDGAKSMAAYVVIGLVVIWAAPFLVDYLVV